MSRRAKRSTISSVHSLPSDSELPDLIDESLPDTSPKRPKQTIVFETNEITGEFVEIIQPASTPPPAPYTAMYISKATNQPPTPATSKASTSTQRTTPDPSSSGSSNPTTPSRQLKVRSIFPIEYVHEALYEYHNDSIDHSITSVIDKAPFLLEVSKGRYHVNFTSSSSKQWAQFSFTGLLGHHDFFIPQNDRSDFAKRNTVALSYDNADVWEATVGPGLLHLDNKFRRMPFARQSNWTSPFDKRFNLVIFTWRPFAPTKQFNRLRPVPPVLPRDARSGANVEWEMLHPNSLLQISAGIQLFHYKPPGGAPPFAGWNLIIRSVVFLQEFDGLPDPDDDGEDEDVDDIEFINP